MARVHYGTSRLYDEYADVIDNYIEEVHGPDYLKTIKNCLDLTAAQRKYKLLVEVLDMLRVDKQVVDDIENGDVMSCAALGVPQEGIYGEQVIYERPTTVEHHGGDYAPVYAVQDVA